MLKNELPKMITKLPGDNAKKLIALREKNTPSAVSCMYPIAIKRGEGAMVEDVDGNIFLDWVGGVGVLNIGYSHPEIIEEVKKQSEKYFHAMPNIMTHEGYVKLAEKLNSIVPTTGESRKTYFANSGAEANENAAKIAKSATGRENIIAFSGAFHGRTMLAVTLTAKKAYSKGIKGTAPGVYRAEYPYLYRKPEKLTDEEAIEFYIRSIEELFENGTLAEDVAGIICEPLQGEGGFIPAPIPWVKAVRKICDKYGILLIADEVQTGFCRTGKMFACDYWAEAGVKPDMISVAKSIAAGVPISAVVCNSEYIDKVLPGTIGGTFGGNAISCASALKTIEIMERDKLADRSMEIGKIVTKRYNEFKDKYEVVGDVRGLGAMIGLEFVKDKASKEPDSKLVHDIVLECANNGLIVESAGIYGNVIRFLCPLVASNKQIDAGLEIMENAIKKCSSK